MLYIKFYLLYLSQKAAQIKSKVLLPACMKLELHLLYFFIHIYIFFDGRKDKKNECTYPEKIFFFQYLCGQNYANPEMRKFNLLST